MPLDDERINEIDERLRAVEAAVVELGLLARYAKFGVLILAAGLGVDLTGFGVV